MDAVQAIADFCAQSEDYTYLRKETDEYCRHINADACMIADRSSKVFPALAFASSDGAVLQVVNIVPGSVSEIGIADYNMILDRFTKAFAIFCGAKRVKMTITQTSDSLTLESAIPGRKTRDFFQRFLNLHPTSYHPSDIERLDVFICAASRYHSGGFNTHRLRRYLMEVLEWKEKDASWCCDRIDAGLDILKVNRKF